MGVQDEAEQIEPESLTDWGAWLARHHGRGRGVWLVQRRRPDERAWDYEESVLEALRFGWVDSTQKVLDDDRSMMWFAPRRPQSLWTQPNRERIERLEAEGRMEAAGRAAVAAARANGNWSRLQTAEHGVTPDDLAEALDGTPGARAHWARSTPGARKAALVWIAEARRSDTRANRVTQVVQAAARGQRLR